MTKKQFIELSDAEIVEDLWECYIFPEDIPFREFLRRYQERHIKKYGCRLTTKKHIDKFLQKPYAPLVLIPIGGLFIAILFLL